MIFLKKILPFKSLRKKFNKIEVFKPGDPWGKIRKNFVSGPDDPREKNLTDFHFVSWDLSTKWSLRKKKFKKSLHWEKVWSLRKSF